MLAQISIIIAFFAAFVRFRLGREKSDKDPTTVSFFHPHSAGRGGGERVLWAAIDGLLRKPRVSKIVIYSIDTDRDSILLAKNKTFNFSPSIGESKIEFRKLRFAFLMEAKTWPVATIIGQSVGAAIVFLFGLVTTPIGSWPDVFVDTTGCPFVLPVAKIVTGAKIAAYIHYPTMSNDMFSKIEKKQVDYNNREIFTNNSFLYGMKIVYYKFFLSMYRACGWFTDIAVANSNWTGSRIEAVWGRAKIDVLYPPAAIGSGDQIKDISAGEDKARRKVLVSLAQFRPEKNHRLQISVFSKIVRKIPDAEFWVMGGARNDADNQLLNELKEYAKTLGIPDSKISFIANAEWSQVSSRLRQSMCAIHTMVDEHFGISLLEFLEAKLPVVAHRSGGPEKDILMPDERFGLLASTEDEFVDKITSVLTDFKSKKKMRIDAYNSLSRFMNDTQFGDAFAKYVLGK